MFVENNNNDCSLLTTASSRKRHNDDSTITVQEEERSFSAPKCEVPSIRSIDVRRREGGREAGEAFIISFPNKQVEYDCPNIPKRGERGICISILRYYVVFVERPTILEMCDEIARTKGKRHLDWALVWTLPHRFLLVPLFVSAMSFY